MKNITKLLILIILIGIIYYFIQRNKTIENIKSNMKRDPYQDAWEIGKEHIDYLKSVNYFGLKNIAVMFDIDDTLLAVRGNNLYKIPPIIKLLNYAKKQGIMIVIITARPISYGYGTHQDLVRHKIYYDKLFLRQPSDSMNFKRTIKKQLKDIGINIILSVGDQEHDVENPYYSGLGLKLPNGMDPNLYIHNIDGNVVKN